MAIFHFEIRPIKRSTGQQATGAAAYRAGETIRDERTGDVHNFSRRKDVRHSEIILPSQFEKSAIEWARDRARLWNTAEAAEKRRDSRVAREYEAALPPELTAEQRLALARSFSRELADRYGVAVDLAIHDPKPGRESQNFHAHMLTTTRTVTPTGLGAKTDLEMSAVTRAQKGLSSHSEEYSTLRERWATLTNEALREANIDARVDHRSLAAQGIERKPLVHIPMEFYQLERNGMPKEAAERLREDYRARMAAYRERSGVATVEKQSTPQSEPAPVQSRDAEEIRRGAVKAWLRMRSKEGESTKDTGRDAAVASDLDRGQDR
jgi:ATP-dependent exoDNAse (exonuclease V) alpha subunit